MFPTTCFWVRDSEAPLRLEPVTKKATCEKVSMSWKKEPPLYNSTSAQRRWHQQRAPTQQDRAKLRKGTLLCNNLRTSKETWWFVVPGIRHVCVRVLHKKAILNIKKRQATMQGKVNTGLAATAKPKKSQAEIPKHSRSMYNNETTDLVMEWTWAKVCNHEAELSNITNVGPARMCGES
jgi:hypothetical protein